MQVLNNGAASAAGQGSPMTGRGRMPNRAAGTPLLIVLAMAQFMVVLDFTIVNVALPSIQTGLHIPTSTLQWLISGYAVSLGGFLLLGRRFADLFGRALYVPDRAGRLRGWPAWPAGSPSSRSCSSPRASCKVSAPRSWPRPGCPCS